MLTVDESGMPTIPDLRQLQDKDVMALFARDTSKDKRKYIQEAGVIYYLGDPNSPANQNGLSYEEALKMAIENFDLPKTYVPDVLVKKLIDKMYEENIGEEGRAIAVLKQAIHICAVGATKINDVLNKKLNGAFEDEQITSILALIDAVNKRVVELPGLTKALVVAYENLQNAEEEQLARGKTKVLSSMNADED